MRRAPHVPLAGKAASLARPARLAAAAALLGCCGAAARAEATSPIETRARLKADVEYLASEDLRGREPGTQGIALAERHVAETFAEAGLLPLPGHENYFLPFELERESFDSACTKAIVETGGARIDLAPAADFRPFDFSGTGRVEAGVVFAGYGITAPEHGWDDYDGLDVAGKVVLVLRHEPREDDPGSPFDGAESTQHATFTTKAETARAHGAAGILVVTDPLHHEAADDLRWGGAMRLPAASGSQPGGARGEGARGGNGRGGDEAPPILAAQVSRAVASRLVAAAGRGLAELQLDMDAGIPPAAVAAPLGRIDLSVGRRAQPERVACRNVAAYLPGRDLELCEQWVVVGAHHDHLGAYDGPGDTSYNGADDNASGTASVLELARQFAAASEPPRRSMVFVTFTAEEKGLLGSRWLVDRSGFPVQDVAFMLNNDMLGRNSEKPIEAIGDGFVRGLREVVSDASEGLGLDLAFGGDGYFGASDHDAFYQRDVPFMFFFTGLHDDYHQVSDHAELIDFDREARIVELSRRVLARVADADARPSFIHHVPWLGIKAEVLGDEAARVAAITDVQAGSRAAKLDLRAGDVITAFSEEPLSDAARVGERFRAIAPGTTALLTLARGGSRLDVEVARPKPGLLGVMPGALEADERRKLGLREDEGLVLSTVTPDGPAAKAGAKAGDILTSLAGQPVSQRTLQGILAQAGAGQTVDAVILRDGAAQALRITLGERPERR